MRVALFIRNGLVGNVALNSLVPQMIEVGFEPVLYNTGEPYYKKADNPELKEVSFLETVLLRDVVDPFMEEASLLLNMDITKLHYTNKQLVKKYDLEYYEVEDFNSSEFINHITNDMKMVGAISIRILPIFGENILRVFKDKGFIWNLHTGLLPKYKGIHIPYRSIENNEKFYGWTLHKIDHEIDTGDIIAMDYLPLDVHKPILETYMDMSDKGVAMVMGALMFYQKRGVIMSKPQVIDRDSYYTYPTSVEMKKWNAQGIIFAKDIVKTYTNFYTEIDSPQEAELTQRLQIALEESGYNLSAQTNNIKVA